MRELFKISSFFILVFFLTAEDCSDKAIGLTYEERQTAMFQDIENEFEKEQLEPEAVKAFERRSLQMVAELVDYLNIYADTSLSKEFRLQAKQMLSGLFPTDVELDSLLSKLNLREDKENAILYAEGENPVHFQIISGTISKNLTQHPDLSYSGNIKFQLLSNTAEIKQQDWLLEIMLIKSQKQFGENTAMVWDVFLGRINE